MTKFATTVVVAALTGIITVATDGCVLIAFTSKESEFADLNTAIKSTKSAKLLGSVLGEFDPLTLNNVTLLDVNQNEHPGDPIIYTPTINSIKIIGWRTLTPKQLPVTSTKSVEIATYTTVQVVVDVALAHTVTKILGFA